MAPPATIEGGGLRSRGLLSFRLFPHVALCDTTTTNYSASTLTSSANTPGAFLPHQNDIDAFPEYQHRVPLNPAMDAKKNFQVYQWGYAEPPSESHVSGGRSFSESLDANFHSSFASFLPFPASRKTFHPNDHPDADRINTQYSNMVTDILPEEGFTDRPSAFSSHWEKLLSYSHGLYHPEQAQELRSEEDVRLAVGNFADRVNADGPQDACKFLKIEHFRCKQAQQTDVDPIGAERKCLKWRLELDRCRWDVEKLERGYSFLEDRPHRKHRAYVAAPDYQFS